MEGTGKNGVSRRAGGAGRAAGSVHTQREEGELSSRGDHFTGSGQQALQPPALPVVPEWRSGAAVRGKKAPARQGQPPARAGGGRTARLCWHWPHRAAGRAEMGRRLPSPPPLGDRDRWTTLPPRWGCPPEGTGVGRGRGRCAHSAGCGRRGGAARPGNLRARRASLAPWRRERQEAPDLRHHPQSSSSVRSPSGWARWPLLGSRRGSRATSANVTCADSRCKGLSRGPGRDLRAAPTPAETWLKKSAPQNQSKDLFNHVSHLRPYPREHWILGTPAARAQPSQFPGGHTVKSAGPHTSGQVLTMKTGLCLWGHLVIHHHQYPRATAPHPATGS